MPRGNKDTYTDKQKRKAAHIEESYEKRGVAQGHHLGAQRESQVRKPRTLMVAHSSRARSARAVQFVPHTP